MKVLAIFSHDKKDSLNGFIFDKVISLFKDEGIDVDILSLYDYKDQIPFYIHDKKALESNEFFIRNKNLIMQADRLFVIYPVYWYSLPGILKCWVDLVTNYAYKYEKGFYAKGLHKIKKTLTVNTSMAPSFYYKFFMCNMPTKQLIETYKFIGIKDNSCHSIGNVYKLSDSKQKKHLNKVLTLAKNLIS